MVKPCSKRKKVGVAINESRNQRDHGESTEVAVNKWLDLPSGCFEKIFANLNPIDALLIIPMVCKDWGRILLEILFCKENINYLDLGELKKGRFNRIFYQLDDEISRAMKLMNLLVGLMHAFASDDQNDAGTYAIKTTPIVKIVFPDGLPLYDRHLVYIAERCPQLECLFFPCIKNITGKGISKAMRFWRGLEWVYIGPIVYTPHLSDLHLSRIIEEIGINCKHLEFLHLGGFHLHWHLAGILVQYVKYLRLLCLHDVRISKYGMQIFLSRCKQLRRVKLVSCHFLNSKGMNYPETIWMLRIQQGGRHKWMTDLYANKADELHTSKDLVNLFW